MTSIAQDNQPRGEYEDLLDSIRVHFDLLVGKGVPLFTTNAEDLFKAFLDALPESERQHHTCHACRHFVERFGGLVMITDSGGTVPVMWGNDAPGFYGVAFRVVYGVVARAKVTGVFLSSLKVWGQPTTCHGGPTWRHMAVVPPRSMVLKRVGALQTAGQVMAEKREDYRMLQRGLADFPQRLVVDALNIADEDALYRTERVQGPIKWLDALHMARNAYRCDKANITWLAVATAPPGFCHVRSTMTGTLLTDLADGLAYDTIKRRFASKMDPLQYQRPQAAPTSGALKQAEKIVKELGSAGSLKRRFARLDDIQTVWTAKLVTGNCDDGSVFGHLTPKGRAERTIEITGGPITWEKFARTVLPDAEKIEAMVQSRDHFIALVTAEDIDAPPILQWDMEGQRNPVSWYVYSGGAFAHDWNRKAGYAPVTAISLLPSMWNGGHEHQGAGAILVIDGCRDLHNCNLALFPEMLKAEYREVRSAIEAYSRSGVLGGAEEASACGLDLRKGNKQWDCRVRVISKNGAKVVTYDLDRWD